MNIHTHHRVALCVPLFRTALLGLIGPMVLLSASAGAAAATCELSSSYAMTTPIIPSGAPNLVWTWSRGSTTPIVAIGCSAIYGNLWGLTSGTGAVTMAATPTLVTSVNLSQMAPSSGIIGYPEVIYGYKPFGGYETTQTRGLIFPMAVNKVPNLWLMTTYTSQITDVSLPMDFAYDLWLTQDYEPRQMRKGDIELMIWLYHQNLVPSGRLLPSQSFSTPMWINGKLQNGTFDVYVADPNLPNHTSELITFTLRSTNTPGGPNGGLALGTIGFNLQPLLLQMTNTLSTQFGWSKTSMSAGYLNGLEIGHEFQANKGKAQLGWALSHYCFVAPKTGLPPTQANAVGFVCP